MQDKTINNALLALWRQGDKQRNLAQQLLEMRGVPLPHHVQDKPLTRGGCRKFALAALREGPMSSPQIADRLQEALTISRKSALSRAHCCLLRMEEKGLVRRDGRVWVLV